MINNINNINNNNFNYGIYYYPKKSNVNFTGNPYVETIKHCNVGSMGEGYIGKIKVRAADNAEAILNVFKRIAEGKWESYFIKDNDSKVIGEMMMDIRKITDYDHIQYQADPSHVWVDLLRNYSKPDTPYHNKELPYYKDIGLRLLQIAQRRSDEAQCVGNIRCISKGKSLDFYKKLGFVQEHPPIPNAKIKICFGNPNLLYLPPHAKEPLSRMQGGL